MAKRKKVDVRLLHFPLIEQAEAFETMFLNENGKKIEKWEIPGYIRNNLVHNLRLYQQQALINFNYAQTHINPNPQHLLFNMATGSGKTDLMAALILYLYQFKGFQNFLFTVNTNSVLMKTIDNLVNNTSEKYLFTQKIEIEGNIINIIKVDQFLREPEPNTIYIKLGIVQNISDDLFTIHENEMGIEDYKKNPVVVLADEAHHYSASTKAENKKSNENTWESAINRILTARDNQKKRNLLLEFTATVDFEKETIYNKYRDKVIYRYQLSRFMHDGFSKMVKRIETSASDDEKMLNVVLLSQFRKYRAQAEGVDSSFKPIIMFKAAKIAISKKLNIRFNELIAGLTVEKLLSFIKRQQLMDSNDNAALELAYNYYLKSSDKLGKIVHEIKYDFNSKNILNAN